MFTMPVLLLLARGLVIPSLIGLISVILTALCETEQPAPVTVKFTMVFVGKPLTGHRLEAVNCYIEQAFPTANQPGRSSAACVPPTGRCRPSR